MLKKEQEKPVDIGLIETGATAEQSRTVNGL